MGNKETIFQNKMHLKQKNKTLDNGDSFKFL